MQDPNYNYQPNNHQPGKSPQTNRTFLTVVYILSVVLAFFFGYTITRITSGEGLLRPPTGQQEVVDRFEPIYELLEDDFYQEFSEPQAFIEQIYAIVASVNDPYTRVNQVFLSDLSTTSALPDYQSGIGTIKLESETFEGLGVTLNYQDFAMVVNSVMRGSPAEKAHIYPGDKIVGVIVGGQKINFKTDRLSEVQAIELVRGVKGQVKTLTLQRLDNSIVDVVVIYDEFATPTAFAKTINLDTGYIKINTFESSTVNAFKEALESLESSVLKEATDTLIIDLRGNPGGKLDSVVAIMQQLIVRSDDVVVGIKSTKSGRVFQYKGGLSQPKPYDIKVLVDGGSASASEVLAAALHYSGNYQIYGTQTFGKNVFQNTKQIIVPYSNTQSFVVEISYTEGYWFYGRQEIINNETNPIPIIEILPKDFLTFEVPKYIKDVKLDEVNQETIPEVQQFLNIIYDLDIRTDGYLDNETFEAIKRFQSDNNLVVNGVYNLETSHLMYTLYYNILDDLMKDNQIINLLTWK